MRISDSGSDVCSSDLSKQPVDVDADRIEVQDRQDRAVFSGNVKVRQGNLAIDAARLRVAYRNASGKGLEILRIDADGGVQVRSPPESERGAHGLYDPNQIGTAA